jgi:hypothetical protein
MAHPKKGFLNETPSLKHLDDVNSHMRYCVCPPPLWRKKNNPSCRWLLSVGTVYIVDATLIIDKQRYMNAHRKTGEGKSSRDAGRRVIYGLQLFHI